MTRFRVYVDPKSHTLFATDAHYTIKRFTIEESVRASMQAAGWRILTPFGFYSPQDTMQIALALLTAAMSLRDCLDYDRSEIELNQARRFTDHGYPAFYLDIYVSKMSMVRVDQMTAKDDRIIEGAALCASDAAALALRMFDALKKVTNEQTESN